MASEVHAKTGLDFSAKATAECLPRPSRPDKVFQAMVFCERLRYHAEQR